MKNIPEIELVRHPETGELVPEEWKDIIGYESLYMISNYGRVISFRKNVHGKLLCLKKSNSGYININLYKEGKEKCINVHRLVAIHFLTGKIKYSVNHKNTIKNDNFILNLEWMTQSENINHAINNGLIKPYWKGKKNINLSKKIVSIKDLAIQEFESIKECSSVLNIKYDSIKQAVRKDYCVQGYKFYFI